MITVPTTRRDHALKVSKIAKLAREQVGFAIERYGNDRIEGLTVWGKWDSELYMKHNENVDGEHGWQHFRSEFGAVRGTVFAFCFSFSDSVAP